MATLIKRDEVIKKTALSATQIYRLIDADDFPKPVKLSARAVAWVEQEVDSWVEGRIAKSRVAEAVGE